jgi:hypothetical protein
VKRDSSLVRISPFIVFLYLLFSSCNVQPYYTSSFNPHNYLQEHCIEYVLHGTTHFFSSDPIPDFQKKQLSGEHQKSNSSPQADDTSSYSYLQFGIDSEIVLLRLNSTSLYPSPGSVHIRFIKHQSFSDSDPVHSFLV